MVDRKTGDRPTLFVPRAAVSITGGIQPGALQRALTAEYMDAGLGARVLMAMPPRQAKQWSEVEVAPKVLDAYEQTIRRLLKLQFDPDDKDRPAPFALRLTPEAKSVWVEFYNRWAREQAEVDGDLAACYSKLEGYAARLALIHHVVSRVAREAARDQIETDSDPVEPASVEAGVRLARWFAVETRRIYAALAESQDERDTRRLVEFIRARGGTTTARQLQRSNPSRYRTAEDAEEALECLVRDGLAAWGPLPPTPRGGQPARVLRLKDDPTVDSTDTTPPDDGGPGDGPPDSTAPGGPDTTQHAPDFRGETGGSVGSVNCQAQEGVVGSGAAEGCRANGVVSAPPGGRDAHAAPAEVAAGRVRAPDTTAACVDGAGWVLARAAADLTAVLNAVEESALIGLDTETTGLDPREDRLRLLSLGTERGTWLVDCFAVDPRPLFEALAAVPVVGHNLAFDLGFLAVLGFEPGAVRDTMILSQLLHGTRKGKGFHGLDKVVERELGRTLPADKQRSDWSGGLTKEQLDYAAADAAVLPALFGTLRAKVEAAGMREVAGIEHRALPAVAWLARSGCPVDRAAWGTLAEAAGRGAESLAQQLDAAAPKRDGYLSREGSWNWDSPEQVKAAFKALGVELQSADDDALAAAGHPLAALVRQYRSAQKLATTYGADWLKHVAADGRVYAGWRQVGSDAGRMSCSGPNLQQLPRGKAYRCCVRAPEGRLLVKADYSQIELRIAAKVSGDTAMLAAYAPGSDADLHTLTARQVLGVADVSDNDRTLAKAVNFGLLYGMGARGFRAYAKSNYGLDLTEQQAADYRRAFFAAYPGLAAWHRKVRQLHAAETRTLAGRRRLLRPEEPDTYRLNSPVQGTGADGLKLALALLWERRSECPGAFPVLAVHDEVVVECGADRADAAEDWLRKAMVDGMAPLVAPLEVKVEPKALPTWGG